MPTNLRTLHRTHCPYCAFQCATRVVTSESGSVSIEGDATFPVNRGELCIKGLTAGGLLAREDRLLSPLIKNAEGVLEPATWEEALDFIAERLQQLRAHHGPDSVGVFGSGALTNEKAYALGKFARLALGTRHIDYNGRYCMASAATALNHALGIDRGLPFPIEDIGEADCVLTWGSNWADTLPPLARRFDELKQRQGTLIVVDPRVSQTAQLATLHLQLTPGSDLALANGMLFVALEEELVDHAFIAERTRGFEAVRAVVQQYFPARVELLTGVSERRLRQATRMMARAPRAMLLSGRGAEQQSKGVDTVLAFINFMLAIGKVGRPFSGYGCLTGQGNGQGGREHGQKSDQLPGYRLITNEAHRAQVATSWGVDASTLPGAGHSATELLDALGPERPGGGGGILGLLVMGSNVAVAAPDSSTVEARLRALELLVVCDSVPNETTAHADVILPVLMWSEEDGTLTNLEGRVLLRRRLSPPPTGPRSDLFVLQELAARLGAERHFAWQSESEVFDELARTTAGARADYSGIDYARLRSGDGLFWPCPGPNHPGTPRLGEQIFAHADRRARFIPVEHRDAAELPDDDYPLYFTTGRVREHYNSGAQTRGVAALAGRVPRPRLQVHPSLLRRYAVDDGALVRVSSRRGSMVFAVEPSVGLRPDTLFAPFHWGGTQAANLLTNPALDPKSRMPEFKLCAVKLAKELSEPGATPVVTRRSE